MNPKLALDKIKQKYDRKDFLNSDPIQFCYEYKNKNDIEIVGFISALFSYGNVLSIQNFLRKLLSYLGKNPVSFLKSRCINKKTFPDLKYRFQTRNDIMIFLLTLSEILQENNSIESIFGDSELSTDKRILVFQNHFQKSIFEITNIKTTSGLNFLIGYGNINSSNKRYNMFLRWMTRESFPDFGIYKSFRSENLLYPVDVHIKKFSHVLGFTNQKSVNLKFSKEITNHIKTFNPKDPLAYDFSLSRLGILKKCKMKYVSDICESCELKGICKIYALSTR